MLRRQGGCGCAHARAGTLAGLLAASPLLARALGPDDPWPPALLAAVLVLACAALGLLAGRRLAGRGAGRAAHPATAAGSGDRR